MDGVESVHPTDETLQSYCLRKLDDASAEGVNRHLEHCPECRLRLAEEFSDTFLSRLQSVQRSGESFPPAGSSRAGLPRVAGEAAAAAPLAGGSLHSGLGDHPDYEILRELGQGGMGTVYLAHNKLMGRKEVLKVVSSNLITRRGMLDRFVGEIRNAARLHHRNIVTAYSATRVGESIVFAMEYVKGRDLASYIKAKGPLPVPHACNVVYQAALGLQYAYEQGLVHRDIKPSNLILARPGKKVVVKVLDFGLAKATREGPAKGPITHEGQMLGTPEFIAPEQSLDAHKADVRADIYSLGCTLYYLLTGRPPFEAASLYELLQAHHSMDATALNLLRPDVTPELATLVARMMAKEPDHRYQTPGEVAQALKPFFKQASTASGRPRSALFQAGQAGGAREVARAGAPAPAASPGAPRPPSRTWRDWSDRHAFVVCSGIVGLASLVALAALELHRPREVLRLEGHTGQVLGVAWSADGGRVLSGGTDQTLRLWDVKTGQQLKQIHTHAPSSWIMGVAILADGSHALSRSFDQTVTLWNLETGEELKRLTGPGASVMSQAWSLDGRLTLSSDGDSILRLLDLEHQRPLKSFGIRVRRVLSFDGRRAFLACSDRDLLLWDVEAGKELCRCTGYTGTVICGALETNGHRALSGGKEGTVRLWDLGTGQLALGFEGHLAPVTSVAMAASGRRALSGSADKTVRLWDTRTGTELRRFEHDGAVSCVAFSPDDRRAISASVDRTIRIWQLPE